MAYEFLAGCYDAFTADVHYARWADYLEKHFARSRLPIRTVLDLACGTGSLTRVLAERGYEMIGADLSQEMLAQAAEKCRGAGPIEPIFLHQAMEELDLYGTIDACVCCLDSINYLTRPRDVQRTFARLHDAIAPGGSLVFDVHAVSKMEKLDGEVLLDEREDVFCLWRTRYRKNVKMLDYEVDLFRLQLDGAWERDFEEHHQRAYTVEELTAWLEEAGFTAIRTHGELKLRRANERDGRIYFSCIRK